jgi:quinol monooxygenase YgiN
MPRTEADKHARTRQAVAAVDHPLDRYSAAAALSHRQLLPCVLATNPSTKDLGGDEMIRLDRREVIRSAAIGSAVAAFASTAAISAANGNYYVIAELVSKPDQADALRAIMVPFVAGARKEPGCIHYALLEDAKQPGRFLTFETWANEDALKAHMVTPEIKAAVPKLGPVLAKPFSQIFLSMVSDS